MGKVGISSGGGSEIAFHNAVLWIRTALLAGENLSSLLKEIGNHLQILAKFHNKLAIRTLSAYRESILLLIDKGSSPQNDDVPVEEISQSNPVYAQRHDETMSFNRV